MEPENPKLKEKLLRDWNLASTISTTDFPSLDDPPPNWVRKEQFKRGQAFTLKNFGFIYLLNAIGSALSFAWSPIFKILLYTANFEDLPRCTKRILDTRKYFKLWASSDLWDPKSDAYKGMVQVQKMHKMIDISARKNPGKVHTASPNTSLEPEVLSKCTLWPILRQDWRNALGEMKNEVQQGELFFSQFDAIVTIMGLFGPALLVPDKVGLPMASKQDLEDYAHVGRVQAYYMGVKDGLNPFEGSLEDIRARLSQFFRSVIVAGFQNITQRDEYIFRMHAESMSIIFPIPRVIVKKVAIAEFVFYRLADILQVQLPLFAKAIPWHVIVIDWLFRISIFLTRFSSVQSYFNSILDDSFESHCKK